jgi:hypothetical protein
MTTTTRAPGRSRPARTIAVIPGSRLRFSRLTLDYPPGAPQPPRGLRRWRRVPDPGLSPRYDSDLAAELLRSTGDLPASKRDLIAILTEYRRALHALITQPPISDTHGTLIRQQDS